MFKKTNNCFTLIELIVVLATITILTSTLLSVVKTGMVKVKMRQCMDNQRNVGLCMADYMTDNQMAYPGIEMTRSPNVGLSFDDFLIDYDGRNHGELSDVTWRERDYVDKDWSIDNSMYQCPGDDTRASGSWDIYETRSYAINQYLTSMFSYDWAANYPIKSLKLTRISRPEDLLVMGEQTSIDMGNLMGNVKWSIMDGYGWDTIYYGKGNKKPAYDKGIGPSFFHDGSVNALMADGRVSQLNYEDFYTKTDGSAAPAVGPWDNPRPEEMYKWSWKGQVDTIWDPYKK